MSAALLIYRHIRRVHQPRVTFKQSVKAEDSTLPLVAGHQELADAADAADAKAAKQLPPTDVEKAATAKPILTTKDEPGWRVAVTALGKLGLIMAYFYLCDR